MTQNTTIVIPAKDEARTIQAVVTACLAQADSVLVVDGSSRDRTATLAAAAGARAGPKARGQADEAASPVRGAG